MKPRFLPTFLKNFLFSLTAVFLFFGLWETALHVFDYQPRLKFESFELPSWFSEMDPLVLEAYKRDFKDQGFVNEDVHGYSPHPVLGYVLKPESKLTVANYSSADFINRLPSWTIDSDSEGFRTSNNHPHPSELISASRTLHVLGDSSSFGWGVENEEAFGSVLKNKMNRVFEGGPGFKLYNYSMPGFTSFQGTLLIKQAKIKPKDVVLISFGANDFYAARESDRDRFKKQKSLTGRLKRMLNHFLFYQMLESFLKPSSTSATENSTDNPRRVSIEEYKKNLTTIFTTVRNQEAIPLFVNVCNPGEYRHAARSLSRSMKVSFFDFPDQWERFLSQVPDLYSEQLITYFDGYGELMEKDLSLVFLFPDHCHPNVIGHSLMAEIIFESLEGKLGLGLEIHGKEG